MQKVTEYFTAVAAKHLSAVDAEANRSNQHEFGGLTKAGFGSYLGDPGTDTIRFLARFLYYTDDSTDPLASESTVSWYDARRFKDFRGPELRLYYEANEVTALFSEGDLMIIALRPDRSLMLFFAPPKSAIASTLVFLFGLGESLGGRFRMTRYDLDEDVVDLVRAMILQVLEIAPADESVSDYHDLVSASFGEVFPSTAEFSAFARDKLIEPVDAIEEPDETLLKWMQHEEALFFALERIIVESKLAEGFDDVDDFVRFSLSVQNRRKSRAGHALEHHLAELFEINGLEFQRGAITENRTKPDFLFPSAADYHNATVPAERLLMLGVKTSCKDRWRQVLSEAQRIPKKHLLTLETAISRAQLSEMASHNLHLVVPSPLHRTFDSKSRLDLVSLGDFIELAHSVLASRD